MNKYVIFLLTVLSIVLADQLTKLYINATLPLHDSFVVVQGFLNITHVRNPGAAFGFLAQASPLFRSTFFTGVGLLAIVLIVYYVVKSGAGEQRLVFALSLILSGALGNLIDRLRFGEVIDFIDVYVSTYHWPAFNVADSAVSIGALLMILEVWQRERQHKST